MIGPFDNLGGFLRVQESIIKGKPIGTVIDERAPMAKSKEHRTSFVYAQDVAQAVMDVLSNGERCHGEAYHIACDERPVFGTFVGMIASELGMLETLKLAHDEECPMISVTMGPIINSKAKTELGFLPTPLADVVKATVAWNSLPINAVYTHQMQEDTDSSSSSSSSTSSDDDGAAGGEGFMSNSGDSCDDVAAPETGQPKEEGFRFNFESPSAP